MVSFPEVLAFLESHDWVLYRIYPPYRVFYKHGHPATGLPILVEVVDGQVDEGVFEKVWGWLRMTAATPPARTDVRKNGTGKHKPIEGPFEPKLLAQAKELAGLYHVVLESRSGSGLVGTSLEMPTVFAKGATADACVIATRQGLTIAIASMLEAGAQPPRPYVEQRRAEQMNIRLDAREKMLLKQAAARHGFRSASDYVRVVALKDAQN